MRKQVTIGIWLLAVIAVLGWLWVENSSKAAPQERVFQIQASQFMFSPGILKVNPGDRVTIVLTSTDVTHGLYLDGYDAQIQAEPGQTATLQFTADRSGAFRFRCSVTCGALHPFMIGKLQVGANIWLWKGLMSLVLSALAAVFLSLRATSK